MRMIVTLLLLTIVCSTGCSETYSTVPILMDECDLHQLIANRLSKMADATVVLLGAITHVDDLGQSRKTPIRSAIRVQLTQVTVQVEQIVRGSLSSDRIQFYFFRYADDNRTALTPGGYTPRIGERRLLFLRAEEGGLRAVGDVMDYTIRVWSGRPTSGLCEAQSPGCCIARVLLSPGEGFQPEAFARHLPDSVYYAQQFCSSGRVRMLVKRLAAYRDSILARSASEVLREQTREESLQ